MEISKSEKNKINSLNLKINNKHKFKHKTIIINKWLLLKFFFLLLIIIIKQADNTNNRFFTKKKESEAVVLTIIGKTIFLIKEKEIKCLNFIIVRINYINGLKLLNFARIVLFLLIRLKMKMKY